MISSGRNLDALLQALELFFETCGFTELVRCYAGKDGRSLRECGRKCRRISGRLPESHNLEALILSGKSAPDISSKEAICLVYPLAAHQAGHLEVPAGGAIPGWRR